MRDMNSKPPRSTKKLSWPFEPRTQMPVCIKPSSFDVKPPWRPVNPKSAAFEPKFRLLSRDELAAHKTMRVCRQELVSQRIIRPQSAANDRETLHCDCLSHWNNNRPSSAPAGGASAGAAGSKPGRPKKRPAWKPGATKSAAFDPNPGLLCDPGSVTPQPSHRERRVCKTCGLRTKPSPVLRNLMTRIENLMSDYPFGWCAVNPTHKQQIEWQECSAMRR